MIILPRQARDKHRENSKQCRFLAGSAPPFAREAFRWSADPANTQRYLANGNQMDGVVGLRSREAAAQLPRAERDSEGGWPYC